MSSSAFADKTSISPSLSISIANTEIAPLACVVISCRVKPWLPSFSYQATVRAERLAESTSTSPSLSISIANSELTLRSTVEILRSVKPWLPSFSSQATVLLPNGLAKMRSISPSLSASIGYISVLALGMACRIKPWLPSFSYQALALLLVLAESTSTSPSPSISIADTENKLTA